MDEVEVFEERVRQRAYALWEQAGRPRGQAEEYWRQARADLEAELLLEQERTIAAGREYARRTS